MVADHTEVGTFWAEAVHPGPSRPRGSYTRRPGVGLKGLTAQSREVQFSAEEMLAISK